MINQDLEAKKQLTFNYPETLELGGKFKSIESIFHKLQDEASAKKIVQPFLMYQQKFIPNRQLCSELRLLCRFCQAYILFQLDMQYFRVMQVIKTHIHSSNYQKQSNNQAEVCDYIKGGYGEYKTILQNPKKKKVKTIVYKQISLLSEGLREKHSFPFIQNYLKTRGYQIGCEWGNLPNERYPKLFVAISPFMKRQFERFGDLTSFDITYNLLKDSNSLGKVYNVGVFCSYDTNNRIVLTGIAVLCQETQFIIERMFEIFMIIHGKEPKAIVTDEQKSFGCALQALKIKRKFSGYHLLDPFHILNNLKKHLLGSKVSRIQCVRVFRDLIKQRSKKRALELLQKLASESQNEDILIQLLGKCDKFINLYLPACFMGINRNSCQSINNLIKCWVQRQTSMLKLMRVIDQIERSMEARMTKFKSFRFPVEFVTNDHGIKIVRECIQRKPFEYFLKNYFEARSKNVHIIEKSQNSKFVVESEGQIFQVQQSQCSCLDTIKTGIPCAHLLALAHQQKFNYISLFHERWIRKMPGDKQEQTDEDCLIQMKKKENRGRKKIDF